MHNNSNSLFFRPFVTTIFDLKGRKMAEVLTEYSEDGFIYDGGNPDKYWKTTVLINEDYPYVTPPEENDDAFCERECRFFTDFESALKYHFKCISIYSVI